MIALQKLATVSSTKRNKNPVKAGDFLQRSTLLQFLGYDSDSKLPIFEFKPQTKLSFYMNAAALVKGNRISCGLASLTAAVVK